MSGEPLRQTIRTADRAARTVATDRERLPIVRRTCPADRRRRRTGTPQAAWRDRDGREPVRQTETPRRAVAARFRRDCPARLSGRPCGETVRHRGRTVAADRERGETANPCGEIGNGCAAECPRTCPHLSGRRANRRPSGRSGTVAPVTCPAARLRQTVREPVTVPHLSGRPSEPVRRRVLGRENTTKNHGARVSPLFYRGFDNSHRKQGRKNGISEPVRHRRGRPSGGRSPQTVRRERLPIVRRTCHRPARLSGETVRQTVRRQTIRRTCPAARRDRNAREPVTVPNLSGRSDASRNAGTA